MTTLFTKMRRFSRSSSIRNNQSPQSPPTSFANQNAHTGSNLPSRSHSNKSTTPTSQGVPHHDNSLDSGYSVVAPNGGGGGSVANESRPISSATDASFDFTNRPVTNSGSGGGGTAKMNQRPISGAPSATGGLSRTDQIVLKHFWEGKYAENRQKDLHYLKFPFFPAHPTHKDLLPYCEIYHLVKTSPGAHILSLGSASGVYIGFELQTGSQLHIDLDDDWFHSTSAPAISHHRVSFRSYQSLVSDPQTEATIRSWPKPLTIEFLEDMYQGWMTDLMAVCWDGVEVGELGGAPQGAPGAQQQQHHHQGNGGAAGGGVGLGDVDDGMSHSHAHGNGNGNVMGGGGGAAGRNSGMGIVDDGYGSEMSAGRGPSR